MPRGQLLEFNVKEGWEPLCLFLGKPAPSEDFPFVKESADHELASQVSGVKSHRRQMLACLPVSHIHARDSRPYTGHGRAVVCVAPGAGSLGGSRERVRRAFQTMIRASANK